MKALAWVASSKRDFIEFPSDVKKEMGHALYIAQEGTINMSRKKESHIEEIECEMSSGNVFADIGVENPEEELTKAKLVWEIEQIIKKRKMTQAAAAKVMGINQPKVSALIRRKLEGFSVERLIHFLNTLGQDIDIVVRQKPLNRKHAVISVYYDSGCSHPRNVPMAANAPSQSRGANLG